MGHAPCRGRTLRFSTQAELRKHVVDIAQRAPPFAPPPTNPSPVEYDQGDLDDDDDDSRNLQSHLVLHNMYT